MNAAAESYVRLVLALGTHDADVVDAYYGPAEWRAEIEATPPALTDIRARAMKLGAELDGMRAVAVADPDPMIGMRHEYLTAQLRALDRRAAMLQGERLSFDDEARALYDVTPPRTDTATFDAVLQQLESALPGHGTLAGRYAAFRARFVVTEDRVDDVFQAALEACRARTREYIELPEDESFEVEYVSNRPWGAYNWYQGHYRSLIQVNTDLPLHIDRFVDLACHEGYPGHHVYAVMLERDLVRGRGWIEYSVYPLYSPQSLMSEGTANFGVTLTFPVDDRIAFERDVLFPAGGLDPAGAEEYHRVLALVERMAYAPNEAARMYLDGDIDRDGAATWLARHALMSEDRARKRLDFIEHYRSYVINYSLGQDLVREYVQAEAGTDPVRRWAAFADLLSSPRLPSGLRNEGTGD